jgi:hypothetical protein
MTVEVAGGGTGDLAVGEARGQVGTDDDGFWSDGPLSAALLAVGWVASMRWPPI